MNLDHDHIRRRLSRISEDDVKHAAIPFLKEFYHHRFAIGKNDLNWSFDNVSEKGYVADVLGVFERPDGSRFVCACEATSLDKIDEVKYRINHQYLWWDATAFGAVCAAFVYGYYYWQDPGHLAVMGFAGNAGLLFGVALVAGLLWFFVLRGWSKYRYIYAIEQFKRYFADEQWVLIAEDVFLSPVDPYYQELVKQCKYSGFGLAIVDSEGKVRKVSDPSRLGMYGKDRKIVHWITDTNAYRFFEKKVRGASASWSASSARALWNRIVRPVRYYVLSPLYKRAGGHLDDAIHLAGDRFNRFMDGQFTQKIVALSAIVITSIFVALTLEHKDTADAEAEAAARNTNLLMLEERRRAAESSEIDLTDYTDYTYAPTLDTMRIRPESDDEIVAYAPSLSQSSPTTRALAHAPAPCSRLKETAGWRIRDNTFSTEAFANERLQQLRKIGVGAFTAPHYCSDLGGKGLVVWLDEVYPDQKSAQERAEAVNRILSREGLARKGLLVQRIGAR